MSKKIEKIKADDVEIIDTSESSTSSNPTITKIRADDDSSYSSNTHNPFEEIFKKAQEQANGTQNNPVFNIIGNIEEIKKIKAYFFVSLLSGIIGLFTLREFFGTVAILFGVADLYWGSKLTKTAAHFGILLGIIDLILYIN